MRYVGIQKILEGKSETTIRRRDIRKSMSNNFVKVIESSLCGAHLINMGLLLLKKKAHSTQIRVNNLRSGETCQCDIIQDKEQSWMVSPNHPFHIITQLSPVSNIITTTTQITIHPPPYHIIHSISRSAHTNQQHNLPIHPIFIQSPIIS